jgi:hypothetical protein
MIRAMSESALPGSPMWAPRSKDGAVLPQGSTLPPPPPGCRYVPVIWLGIVVADDDLRRRVDRFFHAPMIVLALLVLPLLILDYAFVREGKAGGEITRGWLWWLVLGGLTLIWIAFTAEFVIKIAIAESRIEYLRRNWLDVIIIIIPLLRPLRVAALARTSQAFRLRGVWFKLARYVFALFIGMEATNRLMHRMGLKPRQQRPEPQSMTRHELSAELTRLRRLSDDWNTWYAKQQQYLAGSGQSPLPPDHPREAASDSA